MKTSCEDIRARSGGRFCVAPESAHVVTEVLMGGVEVKVWANENKVLSGV